MVRVPLRLTVEVFSATLNATLPEPVPDAPEVMVSHGTLVVAFQTQPAAVVTVLLPEPPAEANDSVGVEGAGAQGTPPKENVLVRMPPLRPPGPTASTTAS
jgi:hypothetical protein